jgi:uncharacterized protein (UPF0548 family)
VPTGVDDPGHVVTPRSQERTAVELRASPLSYVLDTSGYTHLSRSTTLIRRDFDAAARDLLEWRVHSVAGLTVQASDIPLRQGTVVLMRWGPGALSVKIPCRVVDIIDEPRRRGFAYGTLPGHPEAGEERFLLEQAEGGRIVFTITASSRPATTLARLGGPISRAAQGIMTQRYLRALDRL